MLELYTSEGCSSCPPADAWLTSLKSSDEVFKQFIPIAFHVDYWNGLGWPDRFSTAAFTDRQRKHVIAGNSRQSYTPQFVINSAEWSRWFKGDRVWQPRKENVGRLTVNVKRENNLLNVSFAPTQASKMSQVTVNVAILGMGITTEVKAGENHGRTLKHDFVVLNHVQQPVQASDRRWYLVMPEVPAKGPR